MRSIILSIFKDTDECGQLKVFGNPLKAGGIGQVKLIVFLFGVLKISYLVLCMLT